MLKNIIRPGMFTAYREFNCPRCGKEIRYDTKQAILRFVFWKTRVCPHCKAMLGSLVT